MIAGSRVNANASGVDDMHAIASLKRAAATNRDEVDYGEGAGQVDPWEIVDVGLA